AYVQSEVFASAILFACSEGIIPAPESSHAIHGALKYAREADEAGEQRTILFNLSGHGHFDMAAYDNYFAGKPEDVALDEDEIALEPAAAQLFGRLVVDGRGLECLANLAGRESEQAIERLALSLRCRGHVALARDLRVAQFRRRREVLLDLVAMFSDEPVDRACHRGRLA